MMNEPVIGIDLGTTNSVVSVWDWENNRAMILSNEQGNRLNPSIVSYCGDELLVGDSAKAKLTILPESTIFNAKRVIGRRFSQLWKEDLKSWPFAIEGTEDDKPRFKVPFQGEDQLVAPEEISAMILYTLKEIADKHYNGKYDVRKAVITVPAYFTEPQKRATRNAGELAGLEVVGLLTEPTAAALAYGIDTLDTTHEKESRYVLVFDLGGGTLDVSILKLDGRGTFVTKAVTGDFHLGGEDFDERLLQHVLGLFEADYGEQGVELSQRSVRRVKSECERLKRLLSSTTDVILDVELQSMEVCYDISREDFESLCVDLFDSAMQQVDAALELGRLESRDIDDIVLVGGSTRIPKIQEMLQLKFPGKKLWTGLNPDEAVALGAAIQAAALSVQRQPSLEPSNKPPSNAAEAKPPAQAGKRKVVNRVSSAPPPPPSTTRSFETLSNCDVQSTLAAESEAPAQRMLESLVLTSVTAMTLGIELANGDLDVLIPRGTPIPARKLDYYTTSIANQTSVVIRVYEGDQKKARDNSLLGRFAIRVPPSEVGRNKIEVEFNVNAEGLFFVRAVDTGTGKESSITISGVNLSNEEKERMKIGGGKKRDRSNDEPL